VKSQGFFANLPVLATSTDCSDGGGSAPKYPIRSLSRICYLKGGVSRKSTPSPFPFRRRYCGSQNFRPGDGCEPKPTTQLGERLRRLAAGAGRELETARSCSCDRNPVCRSNWEGRDSRARPACLSVFAPP
jgi:hypothetical protein